MLYNRCTGIFKFGNNTAHKTQVEFRSHFSGEKSASYGPGNTVLSSILQLILTAPSQLQGLPHTLVNIHKFVVGGCLKTPTNNLPPTFSSHSSCVPTGHHELSQRVTVPYAAFIHLYPPEDVHLRLETCRGKYFMNK